VTTPRAVVLAALCAGCFAHGGAKGGAREGLTIVRQQGNRPPEIVIVDGERMRLEKGGDGHRSITIVDAAAPSIIEIDEAERTYVELGREQLENIVGIDHVPADLQFDRNGEQKTINGMACEMYQGARSGQVWEEDCIVPWEAGLFHRDDFAASSKLMRERMRMLESVPPTIANDVFGLLDLFPGFPVERWPLMGGSDLLGENPPPEEVKSVTRGPISEAMFSVPAGFAKKPR
jgi:hypothetical protein